MASLMTSPSQVSASAVEAALKSRDHQGVVVVARQIVGPVAYGTQELTQTPDLAGRTDLVARLLVPDPTGAAALPDGIDEIPHDELPPLSTSPASIASRNRLAPAATGPKPMPVGPWRAARRVSQRHPLAPDSRYQIRIRKALRDVPIVLPQGQGLYMDAGLQQDVISQIVQR
jgi:hypothetical protein